MTGLIKFLLLSALVFTLTACGGANRGGAAFSTAPTEDQMMRIEASQLATEAAENALFEAQMERINLEEQIDTTN